MVGFPVAVVGFETTTVTEVTSVGMSAGDGWGAAGSTVVPGDDGT
jgi:hypothetical protein